MKVNQLLVLIVLLLASPLTVLAQDGVEMAEVMRSDGKIYVVVTVASIVMAGIICYLVVLDRKIGRMEKKIRQKQ